MIPYILVYLVIGWVVGYYRTRAWLRRLDAKYPLAPPSEMSWFMVLLWSVCWPFALIIEGVTYEPFGVRKRKV